MRKWIFVIVSLFLLYQSTPAQDIVGCTQILEDAREAYSAGMVELVPVLLLPCLESGLTGIPKQEAYKLVINAYLFDYLPDEADSLMVEFLTDFPDYQSTASDPAEFTQLLRTHQQLRADDRSAALALQAEQERLKEQERIAEDKRKEEEKIRQRQSRVSRTASVNTIGGFLGTSASFPQLLEPYSTGNPLEDGGSFGIAVPGFILGAVFNLPVSRSVESSFEIVYNRTRFNYTATPFPFAQYDYDEYQNRIGLPLSFLFILNPDNRRSIYLRTGIVTDYLISASASGTRNSTESVTTSQQEVVVEKVPITDSRVRFNLYGMAGAGVRIPLRNSSAFFEARFKSGLFMINRKENRFDLDPDITWLIYHQDSDFRLHQLSLAAGIAWNL